MGAAVLVSLLAFAVGAHAADAAAGAPGDGGGPGAPGHVTSEGAEERFRRAGGLYEDGRHDEAAAMYESLLSEGYDDARLHYNLGNARFKQGRLGGAILCYERALERSPTDPDVKENLAYAVSLTTDKVGTHEEDFPATLLARLEQRFGAGRALATLAILSLLGGALAVPLWFSPSVRLRRALGGLVGAVIVLAILTAAVAAIEIARPGGGAYAVVLDASVDGRSAPASDGTVLFTVHEGLKVEVRSERPDWVQIHLSNGLTGWVVATALERI